MRKLLFFSLFLLASFVVADKSVQTGKASYYADRFEGRKTASGEVFSQDELTAAHKTLAFGTLVRVTNLTNDSTVVVKINDRMGARSPHLIDLTKRAARQLDFLKKGVARVKVEEL